MSRKEIEAQDQAEFDRNILASALPQMALFVAGASAVCLLLLS